MGLVAATAVVSGVGGCAAPSTTWPVDAAGELVPVDALVGVRIEGPAVLLPAGDDCWTVRYRDSNGTARVPFLLPEGYYPADIAMKDPSNPGHNVPGPGILTPDGDLVGFANGGIIIAATYTDAHDLAVADAADTCGWSDVVLVADATDGITVDPDGIAETVYTCTSNSDQMPLFPPDLDACDKRTVGPEDLDREVTSS